LQHYDQVISQYTQEEITQRCEAVVKSLQDPPHALSEEASEYYDAILQDMPFEWTDMVIKELQAMQLTDVLGAIDEWIYNASSRKSLAVMIFGNNQTTAWEGYVQSSTQAQGQEELFLNAPVVKYSSFEELKALQGALPFANPTTSTSLP